MVLKTFNKVNTLTHRLDELELKSNEAKTLAADAKQLAGECRDHADELETRFTTLEHENKLLHSKLSYLEDYDRRSNLKFEGLVESKYESSAELYDALYTLFQNNMKIDNSREIKFERAHRLGKKGPKSRPVIVRFNCYQDRENVWSCRFELQGSGIFVREDFSKSMEKARKILFSYAKAAKINGVQHILKGDKLIIEGKVFTTENLKDIPPNIDLASTATRGNETTVLFHGKHSALSNFYPAQFAIDNVDYTCNEPYFQSKKAEEFKDNITARKIMLESDPVQQKRLGGKVKGFVKKEWDKVDRKIMFDGALAKFSQNDDLRDILLATNNKTIAESCKDSHWGTGKALHDPTAFDGWVGANYLGNAIMRVRESVKGD
jgi:hypothetical protein